MTADISFHFPPDLMALLVDTIPRLVRSKLDVILFFQGAAVPTIHLDPLRRQLAADSHSLTKFAIARSVLTKLNEDGEKSLRERREVLKRVVEFEDFSVCWDNVRLEAQGLVQQVRHVVGVKDSFTRMNDERERERAEHKRGQDTRIAELAQRAKMRTAIKTELFALFAETNPWKRGKLLEAALNRVFEFEGILVREAFTLRGKQGEGVVEQIDGVIEFDAHLYFVEMKWHGTALGVPEISQHLVRIFTRGAARALIISDSGYTAPAIALCRDALSQKAIALWHLEEIVRLLETEGDLATVLRTKVQQAVIEREPYHVVR